MFNFIILKEPCTDLTGQRWFSMFYLMQVFYLTIMLTYNFVFSSNLHIGIASKLAWEFTSVYPSALSWESAIALLIAAVDLPLFLKVLREYEVVKQSVWHDFGLTARHFAGGVVMLLLAVTLVSGYDYVTSGGDHGEIKGIEKDSLHNYGMFTTNYFELLDYKNDTKTVDKLQCGSRNDFAVISNKKIRAAKMPSYMFIQVESLDANIINYTWHGNYVTPYLNKLSKNSIYFPYTLSYHQAGGSSDAEMAILNNTEPLSDTPAICIKNYPFPSSIPAVFAKNRYKMQAFHGNVGDYYSRNSAYAAMGFDMFYDKTRMRLESEGWGASDGKVFDFVTKTNKGNCKPIFNYIITMSSHEPFKNVSNYYSSPGYSDVEPEKLRDYYLSIEYVDKMLEKLIERTRKEFPDTYFFIFGDHTPYVLNKGPFKTASFMLDGNKFEFVPLLIITPDNKVRMESEMAASFLDIAPTVLKSSNTTYEYKAIGENLFNFALKKPIPFKGKNYDRRVLFQLAEKTGR